MAKLLTGKRVADKITNELKIEVKDLKDKEIFPKLSILRVGSNPSDLAYERGSLKRMKKCGINTEVLEFSEDINQKDFLKKLEEVNKDKEVHGILIFRPLPKQLNEEEIKYFISPEKDVDCLSTINIGKVTEGDKTGFPPATSAAVIEMLKYYDISLEGKNAVVLGRSLVVGKPLSMLLLGENATTTICHSRTRNLKEISKNADILVTAVGKAKMVNKNYVSKNSIVLDVGINVDNDGKLCGDVNFEECKDICSMITPVPRGVGSVTTSVLAKHVIKATKLLKNIEL